MPEPESDLIPYDSVEKLPVSVLVPYARNARTHSETQVAQIAASIREFGFTNPILIDAENGIIAGHGRVLAAMLLGIDLVPCIRLAHMDGAARRAYILADNKIALNAGWDEDLLALELGDLAGEGIDLGLIGFSEKELDLLLTEPDDSADADAVPEPPKTPVTRPGDVWVMGAHRVMCGDSTDPAAVERLMEGRAADLVFTSPPYAQQRDYGTAKEKVSDWDALMQGVFAALPVAESVQVLVNLGLVHRESEWMPYWDGWVEWMRAQGWRRFAWYVWDQGPGLPGDWNGRLAPSHEFVFHFNRKPRKPNKTVESKHAGSKLTGGGLRGADGVVHRKTGSGDAIQSHRIPDSVFRVMRHKGGLGAAGKHPAVFPVALVEEVIEAFTAKGEILYEPFCGSGTQVVAAEKSGRQCYAMELDPAYVDVAVLRWQGFTGETAVLEETGETFAARGTEVKE